MFDVAVIGCYEDLELRDLSNVPVSNENNTHEFCAGYCYKAVSKLLRSSWSQCTSKQLLRLGKEYSTDQLRIFYYADESIFHYSTIICLMITIIALVASITPAAAVLVILET